MSNLRIRLKIAQAGNAYMRANQKQLEQQMDILYKSLGKALAETNSMDYATLQEKKLLENAVIREYFRVTRTLVPPKA